MAKMLYTRIPTTPASGALYVPWRRLLSLKNIIKKMVMTRVDKDEGTRQHASDVA
jgi:hypothetical protein